MLLRFAMLLKFAIIEWILAKVLHSESSYQVPTNSSHWARLWDTVWTEVATEGWQVSR